MSKPNIIFASQLSVNTILKVTEAKDNVRVIVFEGKEPVPNGALPFTKFLLGNISSTKQFDVQPQNVNEHVGLILYSSGTTGLPKGVQLSQANTLQACQRHQ